MIILYHQHRTDDDGTLTISPSTSTQKGIFMVLVDGEESDDAEINGNTVIVPFKCRN